jgi:hypothetical protein
VRGQRKFGNRQQVRPSAGFSFRIRGHERCLDVLMCGPRVPLCRTFRYEKGKNRAKS